MAGTLFTSSQIDSDGRQLVLDDNILEVKYYSTVDESWDKTGSGSQSWFNENYLPNDPFDVDGVDSDRWSIVDTPEISDSTISQSGGAILLGVEADEGTVSLSSEGKWRLTGDFEIRLYIDWDSYYNEYRSICSTFLKVAYDDQNAVRVAFTFDGTSGYEFRSELAEDRDLRFFDWLPNGDFLSSTFSSASQYLFYKITRSSGTINTYISDGSSDVQVGDSVSSSVFSEDLYVEFGLESKEFNTFRSSFNKFYIVSGQSTPLTEYFSSSRGTKQEFPDHAIIAVEENSLSIIDEDTSKLWMRLLLYSDGPVPNNDTKVSACNGTIYCTTADGLVAFDFNNDKIYKYKGSDRLVADENIALRNAGANFRVDAPAIGNIPDDNIHGVSCSLIGVDEYVAFTHDNGVTVIRALASGVANCSEGSLPGDLVRISDKGSLYWSGYDVDNNIGQLSFFSNITALAGTGTSSFSRTGYYGTDTGLNIFGENITTFDVRTNNSTDILAVGSDEGITFISVVPGGPFTDSISYGVQAPADNPFSDPSFEQYLGIDWKPFVVGFHRTFDLRRVASFTGAGTYSLYMQLENPGFAVYQKDTVIGVYQDVDLTGVERIYFDSKLLGTTGLNANLNLWDFEILIDSDVVKSYRDIDGPFTKSNDSVDVLGYEGIRRFTLRIRVLADTNAVDMDQRAIYIDNLKTEIGDPDFRALPPGNANVKEVLLQYDSAGHKIYFATAEGYGALDLDDNSLDYFIPVSTFVPGDTENVSADFQRIEENA